MPRKPKQPKQQRQSRDRGPQRSTSEPRTEQYRKRHRHSPSTENRKWSRSLSAEDKISQAEGAIKALKRHADRGTCPETLQYRARAKITADEDFQRGTKQICKNAEQETLNAIIRFHQQEIGHFKAETKKGKRASSAIALNTKNCSTIEPARAALAENNVTIETVKHIAVNLQAQIEQSKMKFKGTHVYHLTPTTNMGPKNKF